jgi:hypothetical protein
VDFHRFIFISIIVIGVIFAGVACTNANDRAGRAAERFSNPDLMVPFDTPARTVETGPSMLYQTIPTESIRNGQREPTEGEDCVYSIDCFGDDVFLVNAACSGFEISEQELQEALAGADVLSELTGDCNVYPSSFFASFLNNYFDRDLIARYSTDTPFMFCHHKFQRECGYTVTGQGRCPRGSLTQICADNYLSKCGDDVFSDEDYDAIMNSLDAMQEVCETNGGRWWLSPIQQTYARARGCVDNCGGSCDMDSDNWIEQWAEPIALHLPPSIVHPPVPTTPTTPTTPQDSSRQKCRIHCAQEDRAEYTAYCGVEQMQQTLGLWHLTPWVEDVFVHDPASSHEFPQSVPVGHVSHVLFPGSSVAVSGHIVGSAIHTMIPGVGSVPPLRYERVTVAAHAPRNDDGSASACAYSFEMDGPCPRDCSIYGCPGTDEDGCLLSGDDLADVKLSLSQLEASCKAKGGTFFVVPKEASNPNYQFQSETTNEQVDCETISG